MNESRLLVTTSLSSTLDISNKVLFLGEWCKPKSSKDELHQLNSVTADYHWNDRKKLYRDFNYLENVYEKLLIFCSKKLNSIHKVDFPTDYWRIIIGPWLGQFTQIIFDRWFCIHEANKSYSIEKTIVINFPENFFVPDNHDHFSLMGWSSEWNHYLMSSIIKNHTKIPCVEIQHSKDKKKSFFRENFKEQKPSLLRRLFTILTRISNFISSDKYIFFLNTYLPTWKELFLQIYMLQLPRLFTTLSFKHSECNPSLRDWSLELDDLDNFEKCLYLMVPQNIPLSYLEDFKKLSKLPNEHGWPNNPSMIWTSNSYSSDDIFKIWAAQKTNAGIPLTIGQHGGGIGTHLFAFYEQHQIKISNSYLSWGWKENSYPNVKPIGILKTPRKRIFTDFSRKNLLMVTCALQQQSYHLFSSFISSQYLDYLDDQFKFVDALAIDPRKSLIVRANEKALKGGWETNIRWKERFNDISINFGDQPISRALDDTRICIATYNATVFLETLSMNIPTVMFWNPEHWELRDAAKPYYQELKKAKILFDDPVLAANHVNFIWSDVEGWWASDDVISAKDKFILNFSYQNPYLFRDLKNHFLTTQNK